MNKTELEEKIKNFFSQFSNYNVAIKKFAQLKNAPYKSLSAYILGARFPQYKSYLNIYIITTTDKTWSEAEVESSVAMAEFLAAFNREFERGYTYRQIEAETGISHSNLYKYSKYKVDDITLYNIITLIEYMNLGISIPGLLE